MGIILFLFFIKVKGNSNHACAAHQKLSSNQRRRANTLIIAKLSKEKYG